MVPSHLTPGHVAARGSTQLVGENSELVPMSRGQNLHKVGPCGCELVSLNESEPQPPHDLAGVGIESLHLPGLDVPP